MTHLAIADTEFLEAGHPLDHHPQLVHLDGDEVQAQHTDQSSPGSIGDHLNDATSFAHGSLAADVVERQARVDLQLQALHVLQGAQKVPHAVGRDLPAGVDGDGLELGEGLAHRAQVIVGEGEASVDLDVLQAAERVEGVHHGASPQDGQAEVAQVGESRDEGENALVHRRVLVPRQPLHVLSVQPEDAAEQREVPVAVPSRIHVQVPPQTPRGGQQAAPLATHQRQHGQLVLDGVQVGEDPNQDLVRQVVDVKTQHRGLTQQGQAGRVGFPRGIPVFVVLEKSRALD